MTSRPRPAHRLLCLAAAAVLLTGGCSDGESAPDVAGRTFSGTDVRGHELVAGSQVRLSFEEERVSVTAGCNTLAAGATWDSGRLDVDGPMASTLMACEQALQEQDVWLASFLESDPTISLDGRTLTLRDGSDQLTLEEE